MCPLWTSSPCQGLSVRLKHGAMVCTSLLLQSVPSNCFYHVPSPLLTHSLLFISPVNVQLAYSQLCCFEQDSPILSGVHAKLSGCETAGSPSSVTTKVILLAYVPRSPLPRPKWQWILLPCKRFRSLCEWLSPTDRQCKPIHNRTPFFSHQNSGSSSHYWMLFTASSPAF